MDLCHVITLIIVHTVMIIRVTFMLSFARGYQNVRCHKSQDYLPLTAARSSRKTQKVRPVFKAVFPKLFSIEKDLHMKTSKGQKKLTAERAVQLLLNCYHEKLFVKSYCVYKASTDCKKQLKYFSCIFFVLSNLKYELTKIKPRGNGTAQRLLQYCQLLDKNSIDISRNIRNFARYLKIVIYLFHEVFADPE